MNKADRSTARPEQVDSDILDLFCALGATDEQMDYPLIYASAKQGWASVEPPAVPTAEQEATNIPPATDMISLFDMILKEVPTPERLDRTKPFSMLTTQIDSDTYVGTLYLGRVESGTIKIGTKLVALDPEGKKVGEGKVTKLFGRVGLEKVSIEKAAAGEIVSIAGLSGGGVNVTICEEHEDMKPLPVSNDPVFPSRRVVSLSVEAHSSIPLFPFPSFSLPPHLQSTPLDPPTISMFVSPNDSPFAGKEGNKLTAGMIKERLYKEAETNVALHVIENLESAETIEIRGRGVLHLGILLETLRREGFELAVSPPTALLKKHRTTQQIYEPIEEVTINVPSEYIGVVTEKMMKRKAQVLSYEEDDGKVKVVMEVPARGLIGYVSGEFKNDVHGQG